MRVRGIIILLAVSLLLLSGLSASRREAQTTSPAPAAAAAATAPTPDPKSADLPADGKVKAKPGQIINLRIHSDAPDVAQILELGLSAAVGPGIAGEMTVIAPTKGNYPVTLQIAQRELGVVVVGP